MRVLHPAYKAMKANRGGRIVSVTSSSGLLGAQAQANYAAANSGLLGLTRAIALEGEPHGIKANLLAPGALGTRMHTRDGGGGHVPRRGERRPRAKRAGGGIPQAGARQSHDLRVDPSDVSGHGGDPVLMGGWYGRFGVTLNKGWANRGAPATADDIVEHWDRVVDEGSARDAGLDSFKVGT